MDLSVIIPGGDRAAAVVEQLPRLETALRSLGRWHELIVVVTDSADPAHQRALQALASHAANLRLLRLPHAAEIGGALCAGICAAQADTVVAIEAGQRYAPEQITELTARLARADLVFGSRPCQGLAKAWDRVARLPRWMLLGLEVRDPDCLFWAARREAVSEIELPGGMYRYLPTLVAACGYRVTEVTVWPQDGSRRGQPSTPRQARPTPVDLLSAWWLARILRAEAAAGPSGTGEHRATVPLRYPAATATHHDLLAPRADHPQWQQRRSA